MLDELEDGKACKSWGSILQDENSGKDWLGEQSKYLSIGFVFPGRAKLKDTADIGHGYAHGVPFDGIELYDANTFH